MKKLLCFFLSILYAPCMDAANHMACSWQLYRTNVIKSHNKISYTFNGYLPATIYALFSSALWQPTPHYIKDQSYGTITPSFKNGGDWVNTACVTPDNKSILVGGQTTPITQYANQNQTNGIIKTFNNKTDQSIWHIQCNPHNNNMFLASVFADKQSPTITMWDLNVTDYPIFSINPSQTATTTYACYLYKTPNFIGSVGYKNMVYEISIDNPNTITTYELPADYQGNTIATAPDTPDIYTIASGVNLGQNGNGIGAISIIDSRTQKVCKKYTFSTGQVLNALPFGNGSKVLFGLWPQNDTDKNNLGIWDIKNNTITYLIDEENPSTCAVPALAINQNQTICVSSGAQRPPNEQGDSNPFIYLWNIEKRFLIKKLSGHTKIVDSVHFFDRDTKIISASCDNTVKLWDINV